MAEQRAKLPGFLTRLFRPGRAREIKQQIERLKAPRIHALPDRRVIVVELAGYPGRVAGTAFSALFAVFYGLRETPRMLGVLPCARFPIGVFNLEPEAITGKYALPIPRAVNVLPPYFHTVKNLSVTLDTWEYGEVAEILHVGPYSAEPKTIQRLEAYIREQGYQPVGDHEEEYHVGPTKMSRGNPEKYTTIIRYRVEKLPVSHAQ